MHRYGILVNPRQWLIYTFNEDTMPAWILLVGESSNNLHIIIVLEKRGWSLWYRGREAVSLVHKCPLEHRTTFCDVAENR